MTLEQQRNRLMDAIEPITTEVWNVVIALVESNDQLRYGQGWKAWLQLEKAALTLTEAEGKVANLRQAVRTYQDRLADAILIAEEREENHG